MHITIACTTGHIPDIMGSRGPWKLLEWTNTYGPIYKLQFLDIFTVVLTDPDTIAHITRTRGGRWGWAEWPCTAV